MRFKENASYAGVFIIPRPGKSRHLGWVLLLMLATSGLYGAFLSTPPFFDDLNFFKRPGGTLEHGLQFTPRWLPYWSMDLTWQYFGLNPLAFRLGSLLLHLGTVAVLYFFLHQLLVFLGRGRHVAFYAFAGALLFGLHPVAVFATGYMIQRTVLMATLFSLLMWWAFLRGSWAGRAGWLYVSVLCYFLAAYSKEHAITAFAVCPLLLIWLWRSRVAVAGFSVTLTRHHWVVFLLYGFVAASVLAGKLGLLAAPYEPSVSYLLADLPFDSRYAYPMSVLTQTALFFKYLFLWAVPNVAWMSVDMRVPIATPFTLWSYALATLAFAMYVFFGVYLLWQGGRRGLWGLGLLIPVLMFSTELSTVRIQEPFVLYRSYLWLPLSYGLLVAGLFALLSLRTAYVMLALTATAFALFSINQLYTFTQHLFIWDQAAQLAGDRKNVLGLDRIYHNRGQAYADLGFAKEAMQDYNQAIALAPELPYSYNNRGALLLDLGKPQEALADFERALSLMATPAPNPLMGRGLAYLALGHEDAARQNFQAACKLGEKRACAKLHRSSIVTGSGLSKKWLF